MDCFQHRLSFATPHATDDDTDTIPYITLMCGQTLLPKMELVAATQPLLLSYLLLILSSFCAYSEALSMSKEIYGIKNSGWKAPQWNWGYALGTGHDCAAICRRQYATASARIDLVNNLLEPAANNDSREPGNFEEVKLVLALAWQRGRWDGSDGGPGGYGDVLATMAEAAFYEEGSEEECARRLIQDMSDPERFALLEPSGDEDQAMKSLRENAGDDADFARRRCSGLVLKAMGFIEKGL